MNGALLGLILVFLIVLFTGKHVRRPGLRSWFFLVIMTLIQVAVILAFMYNAESPATH